MQWKINNINPVHGIKKKTPTIRHKLDICTSIILTWTVAHNANMMHIIYGTRPLGHLHIDNISLKWEYNAGFKWSKKPGLLLTCKSRCPSLYCSASGIYFSVKCSFYSELPDSFLMQKVEEIKFTLLLVVASVF